MIDWNPSIRKVRTFGLVSLVALPLAAAYWSHGSPRAIAIAAAIGALLAAVGIAWPRGLRPIVVAINVVTAPISLVLNDLVLSLGFVLVIVPAGLVLRLLGHDPLQLKLDRKVGSYWQKKKQPGDVRSYFRRW